jgi:PIN domain
LKHNFVLVDFENIQPKNIGLLSGAPYKIKVFVGTHQGKIPLEMARALQALGPDAEYIQIEGSGRNALDFHIAYYLGRLAADAAQLHVISKDKGFDPLIKYLNTQKISCHRWTSIADIPLAKAPKTRAGRGAPELATLPRTKSGRETIDVVIENLAKRKAARPRTLKTLRSTIKALFGNQITEEGLEEVIDKLSDRQVITIADGKVSYEIT